MSAQKHFNLSEAIDPERQVFYVKWGHGTTLVQIRRVDSDRFFCDAVTEIITVGSVEGFLVLKDQKGILQIVCEVLQVSSEKNRLDVVELVVNFDSAKAVNRRQFMRFSLLGYHPVTVTPKVGTTIYGSLLNLSAGGALIKMNHPLDKSKIYKVTTALPLQTNERIEAAFLTVYDHNESSQQIQSLGANCYGIHFICDAKVTDMPVLTERKQEQMVRVLNMALLERRKSL